MSSSFLDYGEYETKFFRSFHTKQHQLFCIHNILLCCLDSSVGRASDWRSESQVFDPPSRQDFLFLLKCTTICDMCCSFMLMREGPGLCDVSLRWPVSLVFSLFVRGWIISGLRLLNLRNYHVSDLFLFNSKVRGRRKEMKFFLGGVYLLGRYFRDFSEVANNV